MFPFGPVAAECTFWSAVSVEVAHVADTDEDPLPGNTGDVEDVQRGVGDVPANRAAGARSVCPQSSTMAAP